ncbi:MAG: (2Fe-2S)-binding protein, partial [Rhodocyclaceae bacterium]|nr:(2Fe-2S)-binding protein [Rhodocyclaceae bacterium]
TVIMDGLPVNACLVLAGQADGRHVETVEGLSHNGQLHPLQTAFVEEGAVQCGFCTPGAIMAAKALLDLNPRPTDDEIREALSGNLCRCTGYTKMVAAVRRAAEVMSDGR